jgi:sphingomyelin phosphodiesterase acid-like 3
MRLRRRIVGLMSCAMVASAAFAQVSPAAGRALLISDIHLDPLADPAIVKQLIEAPVSQWEAIFESSQHKAFSPYGSDTNYPLLVSALAAATAQAPFDYVVFTGDALRHNFSPAFVAAGGTAEQFPDFAAKTEAFVVQELQGKLKVPVIAALGNDDSGCGDYQIPPDGPYLAATANALTVLAGSAEAKSTFQLGGYFSVAHPTVANQEILVLNTVFWSASYKSCAANSGDPGEAEMEWLGWKLYNARLQHHGVTLAMHIPPGMDAYTSAHGQCQAPTSFWQAKYATEFGALMSAYSDVVQRAFAGHTHMDDFRFVAAGLASGGGASGGWASGGAASLALRMTPSVSPIFKNNPGFSVMSYSLTTADVLDITTYFLALSSQTPSWANEYQFDSAYQVGSFSAASLSTIAAAIRSGDGGARAAYENYFAVSTHSGIHASSLAFYTCALDHFAAASYSECVCGAAH